MEISILAIFVVATNIIIFAEAKNYYLLSNEEEASNAQYVYSLFGLSKIVSK